MTKDQLTIVIVGGVAGGASAATRARRCNENARIIIFEKDANVSFANCGMPYYIGGEIENRDSLLVASPALFKNRYNIEIHTRCKVTKIDRESKIVMVTSVDTDEKFIQSYDKLIIATGASPFVPPISGIDAPNVFTLHNLTDMDRIKSYIRNHPSRKAVIAGAGFIGLELAEQLKKSGISVSLVELADQVLPPLDPEMAYIIRETLENNKISVQTGNGLKELKEIDGLIERVILDDLTEINTDLVILALGIRPNTDLCTNAGITKGPKGGITVNNCMQTNDPDIYAAGDVIEYPETIIGVPERIPLGGVANRAGRIAGENAATGKSKTVGKALGTAILRVFDSTAAITGLSMKAAEKSGIKAHAVTIAAAHHASYYPGAQMMVLKLVYDPVTGHVLGAQAVGGKGVDKRIDIIATAISLNATVHDLASLDLTYAPPFGSAKDPVHMAAFAASNEMDGKVIFSHTDADFGEKQVLDTRTKKEINDFRVNDTIHIPVDELRSSLHTLDPEKPVMVICHSGLRAYIAARILMQHDFKDVEVLAGGMLMRKRSKPEEIVYGAKR